MMEGCSPVERMVAEQTGLASKLSRRSLFSFQLGCFRETLRYGKLHSAFYRERFRTVAPEDIKTAEDIARLPFLTQDDLKQYGREICCVDPAGISRVITINSSGSEGEQKRLFFTERDLGRTLEFFARGITHVADADDRIFVLLPNLTDASVGSAAAAGFRMGGLTATAVGPLEEVSKTVNELRRGRATCLVGLPAQILTVAKEAPDLSIRSVLLAADYVPDSLSASIESAWGAKVFRHYGTSEMGYGGGVECRCRDGYHMRDADLFFEIVNPETGRPAADGVYGEIVFSTLSREGMPLIRYRTGDIAAMIGRPCACGGVLKRISDVRGRIADMIRLRTVTLSVRMLDELIFSFPEVTDYTSRLCMKNPKPELRLAVKSDRPGSVFGRIRTAVAAALRDEAEVTVAAGEGFLTNSVRKRRILLEQKEEM